MTLLTGGGGGGCRKRSTLRSAAAVPSDAQKKVRCDSQYARVPPPPSRKKYFKIKIHSSAPNCSCFCRCCCTRGFEKSWKHTPARCHLSCDTHKSHRQPAGIDVKLLFAGGLAYEKPRPTPAATPLALDQSPPLPPGPATAPRSRS